MNHKEDQLNEVDALEAIYYNEMTVISKQPEIKYSITIKSDEQTGDGGAEDEVQDEKYEFDLLFSYSDNYPDVLPKIEINDYKEILSVEDKSDLLNKLNEEGNNNLGIVMVYTLVAYANEWLINKHEENKMKSKLELDKVKELKEAEEMKKFEGTRVTVETFLKWKANFDYELNEKNKQNIDLTLAKRLTGRELFERDNTLNVSDLKFNDDYVDDESNVEVDESLFQDIHDLDINELESDLDDDDG